MRVEGFFSACLLKVAYMVSKSSIKFIVIDLNIDKC